MKNIYPRTCVECGRSFMGGPRAWYCPDCRAIRGKKTNAAYRARKREGKAREIGSADICKNCGKKYIVVGSLQKYCPECAPEMIKALDRVQGLEYYKKNKGTINPTRKIVRRKPNFCEKCGKPIPAAGGQRFCDECKPAAEKEIYADLLVDRNIKKRGNSYLAYVGYKGKSIFLKSTTDRDLAINIRDTAEAEIRKGCFPEWFETFRGNKRKL